MPIIRLPIRGMTCEHCVRTVTKSLEAIPGVQSVRVSLTDRRADVEIQDESVTREQLSRAVGNAGYEVPASDEPIETGDESSADQRGLLRIVDPPTRANGESARRAPVPPPVETSRASVQTALLDVSGMHCASCVQRTEQALKSIPGVLEARTSLATNQVSVEFDAAQVDTIALTRALANAGYPATVAIASVSGRREPTIADRERHEWKVRLIVACVLLPPLMAVGWFAPSHHLLSLAGQALLATALQWLVGWPYFQGAWQRLRHASTNMDTLVAIGTGAAYAGGWIQLVGGQHPMLFMDAGMILTFITLGKYLEAVAKGRASAAIRGLLDLTPPTATRVDGDRHDRVPVERLRVGDRIAIAPGERVPLDAEIISGRSSVNQAWLTGESMPIEKGVGDEILAGSINGQGAITAQVTHAVADTALSRVIELVRRAQESKPNIQRFADYVVGIFVPIVLVIGAATFLIWGIAGDWNQGLLSTIAVLVVACPCAMGLATPMAVLVAGGRGAEMGIFVKNAQALELASQVDTVILDKTGTVTLGTPQVTEVIPFDGTTQDELLSLAGGAERMSNHPVAKAIVEAARGRGIAFAEVDGLQEDEGRGVQATLRTGHGPARLLVGNRSLLEKHQIDIPKKVSSWTGNNAGRPTRHVFVARDDQPLGVLAIAEQIAPHAADAIDSLQRAGLRVLLVTGDNQAAAQAIAREAGIEEVLAEVLPAGKHEVVEDLRARGRKVAMVGDGINDAPALAAADVGFAIGAGADVAIESADFVLSGTDLAGVERALKLSRATMRIIQQNLAWAFGYNVLMLPLAAGLFLPKFGLSLPASAAAAAMAASSVSVVLNSLRLRVVRL